MSKNTVLKYLPGDVCVINPQIKNLGTNLCEIVDFEYIPQMTEKYHEVIYRVEMVSKQFNVYKGDNALTIYELKESDLRLARKLDLHRVLSWSDCIYKPPHLKEENK